MNGTIDDHLETKEDILNAAFEEVWKEFHDTGEFEYVKTTAKYFFKQGVEFRTLE